MGKQEKKRPLKLNLKQILFGTTKEKTVPGSRFPIGTQSLVPVVDIQKGVVITEDGRYVKILEVLPTNFYLKSQLEQLNIIHSLAAYLKFLSVRSERISTRTANRWSNFIIRNKLKLAKQ